MCSFSVTSFQSPSAFRPTLANLWRLTTCCAHRWTVKTWTRSPPDIEREWPMASGVRKRTQMYNERCQSSRTFWCVAWIIPFMIRNVHGLDTFLTGFIFLLHRYLSIVEVGGGTKSPVGGGTAHMTFLKEAVYHSLNECFIFKAKNRIFLFQLATTSCSFRASPKKHWHNWRKQCTTALDVRISIHHLRVTFLPQLHFHLTFNQRTRCHDTSNHYRSKQQWAGGDRFTKTNNLINGSAAFKSSVGNRKQARNNNSSTVMMCWGVRCGLHI